MSPGQIKGKKILIVDDDPGIREILAEFLEMQGSVPLQARDSESAHEKLEQVPIDLVISDVNMPGKSGIELLEEIRQGYRIPVIIITGKPAVHAAVESMKLGAVDYLSKPFDLTAVKEVIEKALTSGPVDPFLTGPVGRLRRIGDFSIISVIAEGSMGVVFLAERSSMPGRRYAVKLLLRRAEQGMDREQLIVRFKREAEAAKSIDHPNIIRIEEFGTIEKDGLPYIAMEYFPGKSLKELVAEDEQLSLEKKLTIIRQIADALAALHVRGICHRDIKPANILVNEALQVKLTDFGIARIPDSDLTLAADIFGSPAYLSPEACNSARVDWRSDVFSLGIVAYEFLLLEHPFAGDTIAHIMHRIQNDRPTEPIKLAPTFPLALQDILARMLHKIPEERFTGPGDLTRALNSLDLNSAPSITRKMRQFWQNDWK